MSHFRPIELKHASRLLNHGPTILITSRDEHTERRNVMAAAWSMPVEFEPPRIAIVVDKTARSRELIERSGKFGIVIPGVAAVNWTGQSAAFPVAWKINSTVMAFQWYTGRYWVYR